ncbi:hypothetical protein I7I53_08210 [Histoplasma capsulatum var. duboisii H88]|uniref:Uncharacterized protein n=1 Tax=Ajellomyces capsulatus (strain H88) TaxID=544711 RepID=A0A8A1LL18_AJEC8|nr:hypothetical protein I7I53_08210 [Histoplasma capsulatum var. duboisii H88]
MLPTRTVCFRTRGVSPLSFKFGDVGDGRGTSLLFLCDVPSQPTRILLSKFLQCFQASCKYVVCGFQVYVWEGIVPLFHIYVKDLPPVVTLSRGSFSLV